MPFTIYSIYDQIFKIWRKKRFKLFLEYVKPSAADNLLDVGGYPGSWTSQPQSVRQIDTLNVHGVSWKATDFPRHHIKILVGDGCSLIMPDKSYDIGFSNSVIEHVGSWDRQQQFAAEIRRVAKALWVQTPAYECPIEPHYLTPFIHYFPRSFQKKILRRFTVWGWLQRPTTAQINEMVKTTRLLRKSEMLELFPDCEIITERLFGVLPKSYIAFRKKSF
ncbi:MAG TPA: methyltransferase domain-containing protein [Verrucomicrobiae bacterium]